MLKFISTSMMVLGLVMTPWVLTNVAIVHHWDALKNRKEYSHVLITKKGQVQVYDPNANAGNQHEYRLPYQYEIVDKTLLDMMTIVEGDDRAITLYKGVAKSMLSLSNMGHHFNVRGYGSTLKMSVAGSILGHRDDLQADNFTKVGHRFKEWLFVGYMRSLPEKQQQQMILGEACEGYGVRGCSMLASEMWGRQARTNEERLILVSSTRYYLKEKNNEIFLSYVQDLCASPRLAKFKLKCHQITLSSLSKKNGEDKNAYATTRLSSAINSKIWMQQKNLISFPTMINILNNMNNINPNQSDIEISIYQIANGSSQPLMRVVNNETLLKNGFDSKTNIASVAKLIPMLVMTQQELNIGIFKEMAHSTDNVFQYYAPVVDEFALKNELTQLGVHIDGNNLYQLTHGHASASTVDLHLILEELATRREKMPLLNRSVLKASVSPDGTLKYARFKGYDILIAKSGTHTKQSKSLGGLAVFVVQNRDTKEKFSIVIRQHANNHHTGICTVNKCLSESMRKLVLIAERIMLEMKMAKNKS